MQRSVRSESPFRLACAWGVHAYTALGAALGFIALTAAFRQDYFQTFIMLGIALAIDSSDGTLARMARVKQVVPAIDGELLDTIVDYLNYVIVPAAVFMQPGILPDGTRVSVLLVVLASAYGFSRTDAKGFVEHYFHGFPSYWNVLAFYFVVLASPASVNLTVLLTAVALVFVPMRWLYPSRMESMRTPTILLALLWAVMCFAMVLYLPEPSPMLGIISLFFPLYYTVGSVVYHINS